MALDPQELRSLLEFLSGSDIQELKLEVDDFRLEVRRNLPPVVSTKTSTNRHRGE